LPSTAKNRLRAIALLLAVAAMSTSPLGQTEQRREGRVRKAGNWAVGQYIVVLQDNVDALDVLREAELNHRGHRKHVYGQAVNGFTIRLASSAAEQLAQDPRVKYVQQDGFVHLAQVAASWGLDRIDQRFTPLDTFYNSDALGTGVIVHVLDTGVLASHQDFGGRASVAADYVDDDYNESTPVANDDGAPGQPDGVDCHGHGTHVAATIGGTSFGVAKGVTLRAHRVVNCSGYGLESDVIAAVDTITGTAERPAVVNMSLGGGSSDALDDAIRHSIQAGVVYVVAAGNQDQPAINYSPARVQEAITVGATTSTDARASFSNYGPSVDIFAPGAAITSAWITSDSSTAVLNGTSMATPHVSGLAALLLERDPTLTPAAVQQAIVAAATPNVLTDVKAGSPNLLLHADLDHPSAPQVALLTPVPGQQALSNRPLTIAWDASDREGLQAIDAVLSTNSGLTFQAIPECADLPPAATECQWQSAGPITSTARIRVIARDITGDEAFGQSTADFAIVTKPDLIVSALGNRFLNAAVLPLAGSHKKQR
jgi:subtilisin family serine protease